MPYVMMNEVVKRPMWQRILSLGLLGPKKIVQKRVWVAPEPPPRLKPLLPKVPKGSIASYPTPRSASRTVVSGKAVMTDSYRYEDSSDDLLPAMIGAAMLMADTPAPAPEPEFRSGGGGDFGGGGASATWGSDEPAGWKDYSQPSYEPSPAPAPAYEPPAPSPSYESSWSSSSDSSSSSSSSD